MIPAKIDNYVHATCHSISHSGRALYDHLRGTYDILENAGTLEHVRYAGLFHSIYGTNIFKTPRLRLDKRSEIAEVIGDRAERIAYIFCACNRPRVLIQEAMRGPPYRVKDRFTEQTVKLASRDLYDLLVVEMANLIEQDNLDLIPQLAESLVRVSSVMLKS